MPVAPYFKNLVRAVYYVYYTGTGMDTFKIYLCFLKLYVNFKKINRNGIGDTLWKNPMTGQKHLWAVKVPIGATLSGNFRIRPPGYDTCQQRAICAGLDVLQRRPYFSDSQFQSKLLGMG